MGDVGIRIKPPADAQQFVIAYDCSWSGRETLKQPDLAIRHGNTRSSPEDVMFLGPERQRTVDDRSPSGHHERPRRPARHGPRTRGGRRGGGGALLLDLEDPSKVIARSEDPIMEPIASYEQTGFFGNVVFTNGHYVDGDRITMYYGASDEVICKAEFSIKEILNTLK